jgi:hypothetical protein
MIRDQDELDIAPNLVNDEDFCAFVEKFKFIIEKDHRIEFGDFSEICLKSPEKNKNQSTKCALCREVLRGIYTLYPNII